jgi:putative ABC transport system permease protein
MGASVPALIAMMSRTFVTLCVIAIFIGCPIAYFLMDAFLESFAYHTDIDWKIFATTSATVIVGALTTVILQVFSAATANPVAALRNE